MSDAKLTEGNLYFKFHNVDRATKYDDWNNYRKQFISGAKAVDFIIVKGSILWLIEVRDYRRHKRTKPSDLSDEMAQKVMDTMAGLVSAQFIAKDENEKDTAKTALQCRMLRIVLHLEQPKNPSKLFPLSVDPANLKIKLRQKLKFADPKPLLCDTRSFPEFLGNVTPAS